FGVLGKDPAVQLALAQLARHNGRLARFAAPQRLLAPVEPQFRLARRVVGAVAFEAVPRQDRPDALGEKGLVGGARRQDAGEEATECQDASHEVSAPPYNRKRRKSVYRPAPF